MRWKIHGLDWKKKRQPISRSKLALEVAKKVKKYFDSIAVRTSMESSSWSLIIPSQESSFDGSVEGRWKASEGFMHIENMFLVRLASVSKGSFQPEIWIADPSVGSTCPF